MKIRQASPRLFHKKDLFWIVAILLLACVGLFAFSGNSGTVATVRLKGEAVQTISLTEDHQYTFQNNGITLTVTTQNNAVFVSHSTCPDSVCVQTGRLTKAGQAAVCLPAEISVTVEGDADQYDGTTY